MDELCERIEAVIGSVGYTRDGNTITLNDRIDQYQAFKLGEELNYEVTVWLDEDECLNLTLAA